MFICPFSWQPLVPQYLSGLFYHSTIFNFLKCFLISIPNIISLDEIVYSFHLFLYFYIFAAIPFLVLLRFEQIWVLNISMLVERGIFFIWCKPLCHCSTKGRSQLVAGAGKHQMLYRLHIIPMGHFPFFPLQNPNIAHSNLICHWWHLRDHFPQKCSLAFLQDAAV